LPRFVEIPSRGTEISHYAKKFRNLVMTLTSDIQNLFSNGHSDGEYLFQLSFKIHPPSEKISRHVEWLLMDGWMHRQMDGRPGDPKTCASCQQ